MRKLREVGEVESTNTYLAEQVAAQPGQWAHLDGVYSFAQTRGRGRTGRQWVSTDRALAVSFLVEADFADPLRPWIPLLSGTAAVNALRPQLSSWRGIGLKWPNDILIEFPEQPPAGGFGTWRKVGGVLSEGLPQGAAFEGAVVVGIGLNISGPAPLQTAATLSDAGWQESELPEFLERLSAELERALAGSPQAMVSPNLLTLGAEVVVHRRDGTAVHGTATGLGDDGALIIAPEGAPAPGQSLDPVQVREGDVKHLRLHASSTLAAATSDLLGIPRLRWEETWPAAQVSEEVALSYWRSLGFPDPGPDSRFTASDVEAMRSMDAAVQAGAFSGSTAQALGRAHGYQAGRLVLRQYEELVAALAKQYQLDDTSARLVVLDRFTHLAPLLEAQFVYTWRRHAAELLTRLSNRLSEVGNLGDGGELPLERVVGFADMVDYTRTSSELGRDDLEALVNGFDGAVRNVVAAGGGRVVKTLGDGVLFVADTLQTGTEVARSLCEPGLAGLPVHGSLVWGRVLSRSGDVYGPAVNLAARLVDAAGPGEVLMDGATARQIDPAAPLRQVTLPGFGEIMVSSLP